MLKTDANGNVQWNKSFGGKANDSGVSVIQTNDGGYVVTGTENSEYFPWNLSTIGDAFLIKTDSEGNKLWNISFGGTGGDIGWTVKQTNDDGFIIAGYTDSFGAGNYDAWLIKVKPENQPPNIPNIDGPTSGKPKTEHTYTLSAIDPDEDDIAYYLILWDDDTHTNLTGPFPSGEQVTASHKWAREGTYTILARATDVFGKDSYWGMLDVTIPRSKNNFNHPLLNLFSRLFNSFPLLRILLQPLC